jgi:WD40 repeat protein
MLGPYKLVAKIGEGGFGVVYSAEQQEPVRRRVAVKVIKLGLDTVQIVARFEAERQALAMMDHPNIARVFDAGALENGRPFFVMEFVPGIKITEFCDQARLSIQERLRLFIQVCQAIQHAHQKGIIHRDIKPSNILVSSPEEVPVPKIIDFGIAKATQGRLTDQTGLTHGDQLIGTPAYMSPEQAGMANLDIDTRTDIYSLGVLLFELLTGKTPFDQKELLKLERDHLCQVIRQREPPRPSARLGLLDREELQALSARRRMDPPKLVATVAGDLDWIVMKCLEKDRSRRYDTAVGLARDVERHLENEPVLARPPGRLYRLQKLVQRNKLACGAAAAVALAMLLGASVSLWQAVRATQAELAQRHLRENEARLRVRADRERRRAEAGEYSASINLAQPAWEQNKSTRLGEILDETSTYPKRGFEWFYWQRQIRGELFTLRGHSGPIRAVAFSPDSQRIATGSEDHTVKIWEAATGNPLLTLSRHSRAVNGIAFSPDGQRLVTAGDDETKVWDAISGMELFALSGPNSGSRSASFSADGQYILTARYDQTARTWDAATGHELLTLSGHTFAVMSAAFASDGQRVVTGGWDSTVRLWQTKTATQLRILPGHSDPVRSVAFSPDGRRIVSGSDDQTARVWDCATGQELVSFEGHAAPVLSVVFSSDGQNVLSAGADLSARLWNATTGKQLLILKGHTRPVTSAALSPDGKLILTGSEDNTAKLWASVDPQVVLKAHLARINSAAFSPDGQRIATGSDDKTVRIWAVSDGQPLQTVEAGDPVTFVAFSADGQSLITRLRDGRAVIWDPSTGNKQFTFKAKDEDSDIHALAISADGQRVVGLAGHKVKVWQTTTGKPLLTLEGNSTRIASLAFSRDGQRIISEHGDNTVQVWDAASGKLLRTLRGHTGDVLGIAVSPDGQRIASASRDGTAKVWKTVSGKNLLTLKGHTASVRSISFSPDGQRIVTGGDDNTAKLWEANTGRELLTLKGHTDNLTSVAFSPDGLLILTASWDHTARLWAAATDQEVARWQAEESTAAQRLALQEQEKATAAERDRASRLRDPGAIKQWLILGPIPIAGRDGPAALDQQQLPNEPLLQPHPGDPAPRGISQRTLTPADLSDDLVDFNEFFGAINEWSLAYAVSYIQSQSSHAALLMKIGSDDQSKVYLNGNLLYRRPQARTYVPDEDVITNVELRAGLNVLVFKVLNQSGDWQGSVRFTDAAGQPVPGLRTTLDPRDSLSH